MPFRNRRRPVRARRARPARRLRRATRSRRSMNPMSMGCKIVEVEEYNATGANVGGIVTTRLRDYARALRVASSYKYFRCEKVELEFIPRFNTFQGSDNGISKPELYYQTNKQTLITAPTKAILQARGCSPIQWTKPIKKVFRPAIMRGETLYGYGSNLGVLAQFSDGVSFALAQIGPAGALWGPTGGVGTVSGVVNGQAIANTTGQALRQLYYQAETPVHGKWYSTQAQSLPSLGSIVSGPNASTNSCDPQDLTYFGAEYFITVPGSESDSQFISGRIVLKTTWGFKGARSPVEVSAGAPA